MTTIRQIRTVALSMLVLAGVQQLLLNWLSGLAN